MRVDAPRQPDCQRMWNDFPGEWPYGSFQIRKDTFEPYVSQVIGRDIEDHVRVVFDRRRKTSIDFFAEIPFAAIVGIVPCFDAFAYAGFIRKAGLAPIYNGLDFSHDFFYPSDV